MSGPNQTLKCEPKTGPRRRAVEHFSIPTINLKCNFVLRVIPDRRAGEKFLTGDLRAPAKRELLGRVFFRLQQLRGGAACFCVRVSLDDLFK